jgi:hypothetical protein
MKTSALIAILMAGVTFMSAANIFPSENTRCRELAKSPVEMSDHLFIAKDLMNGIWVSDDDSKYEFGTNGTLAVFSNHKNEQVSADLSGWKVEMLDGAPVLLVLKTGAYPIMYDVEQTCEGIKLVNKYNHDVISLDFVEVALPGHACEVKKNLLGAWTNVTLIESDEKCEHGKGAYLNYDFAKDGTYQCKYGSQTLNEMEIGTWSVSKDGQFLLLTSNLGSTSVVRIDRVDNHGLILEQVMTTNEIGDYFCSEQSSFTFIK